MHYSPGYASPRPHGRGFHRPISGGLLLYKVGPLGSHTLRYVVGDGDLEFLVPGGAYGLFLGERTVARPMEESGCENPGWPPGRSQGCLSRAYNLGA